MLYLESEMPKWLSKYSSVYDYDPAKAEERMMENGFTIVTDKEEQKTLYNYFVEAAHKNVAIAGCEKAKAIKCGVIEQELSYTMTLLWIFLFDHKYEIQIALTCASFIGTIVCEAICLSMGFVLGYFSYLIWKRLKVTIPEPLPQ